MRLPKLNTPKSTTHQVVPSSFLIMVHNDIQRCEAFLSGTRDVQEGTKLHNELISKYRNYIDTFDATLYGYITEAHVVDTNRLGFNSIVDNIESMKHKLIAFEASGCRNALRVSNIASGNINIENTLTSVQTQHVIMDFDAVIEQVQNMPGLSENETQETLEKVNEIKAIVESKGSPKTKWQRLKPILVWIADKSVDVGVALLPLLLKIQP